MSYEIKYLPTFIDNLRVWYAEKYSTEDKLAIAFDRKIERITRYLEKEFKPICDKYADIEYVPSRPIPRIIWIMWWQGEENMPPIVKSCLKSVQTYAKDFEIRIITEKNYSDYVDVSDVIKYRNQFFLGKERLLIQHFSDILRMRLLAKHGGIWLDATMFLTSSAPLEEACSLPFFTIKLKKEELTDNKLLFCPEHGKISDSFWASSAGNPFFSYVSDCLTYHTEHHKSFWDYFVFEYALVIGERYIPFLRELLDSIPASNPRLYWIEKHVHEKFDKIKFAEIQKNTNVFKLSYWNMKEEEADKQTYTFYDYIIDYHTY